MAQQHLGELNMELANLNKYPPRTKHEQERMKEQKRSRSQNKNMQRKGNTASMGSTSSRRSTAGKRQEKEIVQRRETQFQTYNKHIASSKTTSKKRRRRLLRNIGCAVITINICIVALYFFFFGSGNTSDEVTASGTGNLDKILSQASGAAGVDTHPEWKEDFLTVSEYARPGTPIGEVKNIFVHYTANPGTSAAQNRSYFEQLKDTKERSASSHFIIGYEGEIIQCVPLDEIAYAVMTRNEDSISIECCYIEKDGSFTQETYDSLIKLLGWLVDTYHLDVEDILRHYDCGGKKCPLYYVENEDMWEKLKQDVKDSSL